MSIELSEAEGEMILENRKKQEEFLRRKTSALHLLKTAYDYETWLQAHGRESSFTTFLDEFGYDGIEGKTSAMVFKQVSYLRESALNGTY
jgi:hypothetical protein